MDDSAIKNFFFCGVSLAKKDGTFGNFSFSDLKHKIFRCYWLLSIANFVCFGMKDKKILDALES